LPYGITADDIKRLAYESACWVGEKSGAKPLSTLSASLVGNPEDILAINDNFYTWNFFSYYLQYAYCSNFIDFDSIEVLVELGPGGGKQAEVIKKLHPHICILLFDIPPQLYVCEQYLKAVFPDCVVPYKQTREMISIPEIHRGKIFIFGNWKFPIVEGISIDLFWNSSSLQEMEPDVVANYLEYVNAHAQAAYLREVMAGQEVAKRKGMRGVLRQTRLEHYESALRNFAMVDLSPFSANSFRIPQRDSNSFWKRVH
jgi:putative sugar O-methyltransferase